MGQKMPSDWIPAVPTIWSPEPIRESSASAPTCDKRVHGERCGQPGVWRCDRCKKWVCPSHRSFESRALPGQHPGGGVRETVEICGFGHGLFG